MAGSDRQVVLRPSPRAVHRSGADR
jgi:hypothetical protein